MSRKRVHVASPVASGAAGADDDDSAFDRAICAKWFAWRASYPVRAPRRGGVRRTDERRPIKPAQQAWSLYTIKGGSGKIIQEWWMPPFLVPIADVAPVQGGKAGNDGEGGFAAVPE